MRLKLSEQRIRTKHSPVHALAARRIQNTVHARQRSKAEWVWIGKATALIEKRLVQQGIKGESASTKWRLSAELFQHQLLDWVIEQPPTRANAGFAGASGAPGDSDSRSEGFGICLCQGIGYSRVSRHNQADRGHRRAISVGGVFAGINLAYLSRPEGLYAFSDVRDRSIQFPAQPIVERQVWLDLPAVLCEQIQPGTADVLMLR